MGRTYCKHIHQVYGFRDTQNNYLVEQPQTQHWGDIQNNPIVKKNKQTNQHKKKYNICLVDLFDLSKMI